MNQSTPVTTESSIAHTQPTKMRAPVRPRGCVAEIQRVLAVAARPVVVRRWAPVVTHRRLADTVVSCRERGHACRRPDTTGSAASRHAQSVPLQLSRTAKPTARIAARGGGRGHSAVQDEQVDERNEQWHSSTLPGRPRPHLAVQQTVNSVFPSSTMSSTRTLVVVCACIRSFVREWEWTKIADRWRSQHCRCPR